MPIYLHGFKDEQGETPVAMSASEYRTLISLLWEFAHIVRVGNFVNIDPVAVKQMVESLEFPEPPLNTIIVTNKGQ